MYDFKDDETRPFGERIRNVINPALEDERKHEVQLGILNKAFENIARQLSMALEQNLSDLFNKLSSAKSAEDKNLKALIFLTLPGEKGYSPIATMGLPVSTAFTDFSASDIKELPGYIALHEAARDADVAVSFKHLLADDIKSHRGLGPGPVLIIDAGKTYEEGSADDSAVYPNLPEKVQPPVARQIPAQFRL